MKMSSCVDRMIQLKCILNHHAIRDMKPGYLVTIFKDWGLNENNLYSKYAQISFIKQIIIILG